MRPLATGMIVLALCAATPDCSAQPRNLSPDVAKPTVVVVLSARREEWSPTPTSTVERIAWYPAAGTIVGWRGDSLYIVTSYHHVQHAEYLRVQLLSAPDSSRVATMISRDTALDLAVLTVRISGMPAGWKMPVVPKNRRGATGQVYALGCARGSCWADPEEAAYLYTIRDQLVFRSPFLVTGLSGGPLVNEDGALLGIVIEESEGVGVAIRWGRIVEELQELGVPMNLEELRANSSREGLFRYMHIVSPSPGWDHDGERLAPGFRIESGVKLAYSHVLLVGASRLSFTDNPFPRQSRFSAEPNSCGIVCRPRVSMGTSRTPHPKRPPTSTDFRS
jgi:hypothetical protein